ncbi:hypothetical protein L208DRAFT_1240979 [Tricholoma matsutake]|nr:hypothetical protein L208DRAFT_1240979 [Tricholoma matsutake 945]
MVTRTVPTGPSKLSKILAFLNAPPKLTLTNLKSLKLTLAFQNDHFGARHFVKEQLPRIRYANPTLDIQVEKLRKTPQDTWRPEMELHFTNGSQKTLDMHEKWSTTILKELMELAGGDPWRQWKVESASAGLPLVPGEENEHRVAKRTSVQLPSLKQFRASIPPPPIQESESQRTSKGKEA